MVKRVMLRSDWRELAPRSTTLLRDGVVRLGVTVKWFGFGVRGSGVRVWGSGFRVQGSGFGVQGVGFRVWGSGFGAQGVGSLDRGGAPP